MMIRTEKPSKLLSEYIKYYWILENESIEHSELIYPTGEMQILFHYHNPFIERDANNRINKQPQFAIAGQKTTFCNIKACKSSGMIAAVFYPYSASAIFPFELGDITNYTISLADVFKDWIPHEEKFINCLNYLERIKIIEDFLLKKIFIRNPYHYSLVKACIQDFTKNCGILPIREMCTKYNLTERTLQRIFNRYIGLSPKNFSEIVRLEQTIELFKTNMELTDICFEAGYYDQSHFIRKIRQYTGYTPNKLMKLF